MSGIFLITPLSTFRWPLSRGFPSILFAQICGFRFQVVNCFLFISVELLLACVIRTVVLHFVLRAFELARDLLLFHWPFQRRTGTHLLLLFVSPKLDELLL